MVLGSAMLQRLIFTAMEPSWCVSYSYKTLAFSWCKKHHTQFILIAIKMPKSEYLQILRIFISYILENWRLKIQKPGGRISWEVFLFHRWYLLSEKEGFSERFPLKAFITFCGVGLSHGPFVSQRNLFLKAPLWELKFEQMTLRGRYKYSDRYREKLTSGGNVTGSEISVENRLENQVIHNWEKQDI